MGYEWGFKVGNIANILVKTSRTSYIWKCVPNIKNTGRLYYYDKIKSMASSTVKVLQFSLDSDQSMS